MGLSSPHLLHQLLHGAPGRAALAVDAGVEVAHGGDLLCRAQTPLVGGTVAMGPPTPSRPPGPLPLMALPMGRGRQRGCSMVVLWAMSCPVAEDRASVSREKK